jgi:hypothetical protein
MMMIPGTNRGYIPPEVQRALGAELRFTLSSWANRLPWKLVRLARRAHTPPNKRLETFPSDEPVIWSEKGVLDATSIAILDKAFQQAWGDLRNADHAADKETLARCLSQMIKTERDPSRLATKAVIRLILASNSSL